MYDGWSSERFNSRPTPPLLASAPTSGRATGKRGQRWVEGVQCHPLQLPRQGRLGDGAQSAVSHLMRGIRTSRRVGGACFLVSLRQRSRRPNICFLFLFFLSFQTSHSSLQLDASFSPSFPFQPLTASSIASPFLLSCPALPLNLHRWGNEAEN